MSQGTPVKEEIYCHTAINTQYGSKILHRGMSGTVCGIEEGRVWLRDNSLIPDGEEDWFDWDEIQPIPLTEELLDRSPMKKEYDVLWCIGNQAGRWIESKHIMTKEPLQQPFLRFDGLCDIYYLHELQDLFKLVKEEFTLNQPK